MSESDDGFHVSFHGSDDSDRQFISGLIHATAFFNGHFAVTSTPDALIVIISSNSFTGEDASKVVQNRIKDWELEMEVPASDVWDFGWYGKLAGM
jgi:hypothetical protein